MLQLFAYLVLQCVKIFVRVSCRLGTRLMDKWLKQCVKFVCVKLFDDFVLDLWTDVGLL